MSTNRTVDCKDIIEACKKGDAGLEDLLSAIEKAKAEVWPAALTLPHACLLAAVRSNCLEAATILIQNGAAMDSLSQEKSTANNALYCAAGAYGNPTKLEMVKLLLKHGANPHALKPLMPSALSTAISCSRGDEDGLEVVKLLVKYANDDDLNEVVDTELCRNYYTTLMIATDRCSSSGIIRELINAGATLVNTGKYAYISNHSNAIQSLVRHHPRSIASFEALLSDIDPFNSLGNISIEDSIDNSFGRYDCIGCWKCGKNRQENHRLLIQSLEHIRIEFVKKNCFIPLLQSIPKFDIIPGHIQEMIVERIDEYEVQAVQYASEVFVLQVLRKVLPFLSDEILLIVISFLE